MNKKSYIKLLFLFLAIALLFTVFVYRKSRYIEIGGQRIKVEIADTAAERQKGLMYRKDLCQDCGMLFVFDQEDFHNFWMKNTLIPLDIVFINADFKIVDIVSAEPCAEESCPFYSSSEKFIYALEINKDVLNTKKSRLLHRDSFVEFR